MKIFAQLNILQVGSPDLVGTLGTEKLGLRVALHMEIQVVLGYPGIITLHAVEHWPNLQ